MTAAQGLGLILQASIMLTVLALGLTASFRDATFLFRRPALLLRAVLSMNVVMPVIGTVIATTSSVPFEVKVALVALAVSPVPPIIQKKQITAGGRKEYVVGLLVTMSVLAIVLVPLSVMILDKMYGRAATLGGAAVAKIMLRTVLAPLLVGLLIRRSIPAAEKAASAIITVAGILLIIGCGVLLYGLWPITRTYLGNGVALELAVLAVIGLAVGHFFGGPVPGDRTALATSGTVSEPKPELAIILLYLVVATIVTVPYQKWRVRAAGALPHIETGSKA
jgi:BASS family bile acid:Na+ symporter